MCRVDALLKWGSSLLETLRAEGQSQSHVIQGSTAPEAAGMASRTPATKEPSFVDKFMFAPEGPRAALMHSGAVKGGST